MPVKDTYIWKKLPWRCTVTSQQTATCISHHNPSSNNSIGTSANMYLEDEEAFSQAKDFGFKLAVEVRQLRKTNEENKTHIADLTETKDVMIRKYEALFAKHQASERNKESLESKCLSLEDLVQTLERQFKIDIAEHKSEYETCSAKLVTLGNINNNLQNQLNRSTDDASTLHSELVSLRNQLSTVNNENVLLQQKVDNLNTQLKKTQSSSDSSEISIKEKDDEVLFSCLMLLTGRWFVFMCR